MKRILALILVSISTFSMMTTVVDAAVVTPAAGGAGRALRRMSVRGMWGKASLAPRASTYDDVTPFRQEFRVTPGFKEAFCEVMADIWLDEVVLRASYDPSLDYDPRRHSGDWIAQILDDISNDLSPLAEGYVGDDAPHAMVKVAHRILPLFQATFNAKYRAFYLTKDNSPVTHDAAGNEYEAPMVTNSSIINITTGKSEPICLHRWPLDVLLPREEETFGVIDLRYQRSVDGSVGNVLFNQEDSNILNGELNMYMHTCITNAACLIKIIALCTYENVQNIPLCEQVVAAWKMVEENMVRDLEGSQSQAFLERYGHSFIKAVDYHLGKHDPLCDVDHLTEKIKRMRVDTLIPLDNFFRFGALVGEAVAAKADLSGFPLLYALAQPVVKGGGAERDESESEYDTKSKWKQFADIMKLILYPCENGFLEIYGENIIAKIEAGFMAAFSFQKMHAGESYAARYLRDSGRASGGAVRAVHSGYHGPLTSLGSATMHSGESTVNRGAQLRRRSRSHASRVSSVASPSGGTVHLPAAAEAAAACPAGASSHKNPSGELLRDYDNAAFIPRRGGAAAVAAAGTAYRVRAGDTAHRLPTAAVVGSVPEHSRPSGDRVTPQAAPRVSGTAAVSIPAVGSVPLPTAHGAPSPEDHAVAGALAHQAGRSGDVVTASVPAPAAAALAPGPAHVGQPRRPFLGIPWCCS